LRPCDCQSLVRKLSQLATYNRLLPAHRRRSSLVLDKVSQSVFVCIAVAESHQRLELPSRPGFRWLSEDDSERQVHSKEPHYPSKRWHFEIRPSIAGAMTMSAITMLHPRIKAPAGICTYSDDHRAPRCTDCASLILPEETQAGLRRTRDG
jgi:hypothetical protein